MRTQEFSNNERLVLLIVQETNLDVEKASVLFDHFERENESNNSKMTQADIRSWLIRKGVEIKSQKLK
jgi:hypothetical protein